ncbi:amino acid ABC transporter substrate-binding protein, PAAT family (TC 3.A.1.3.-) [Duganella sp. CF402]|uniref:substrate-binding periplasmic protein n=1 Tax=unclassified Duganella TaxID=2636909 RepID=UPI0008C794C2|nr:MULTISPECIES: ABC transporter substrate-binding protein [unclassified Duganella]RZT11330.1 amino acid ABC transporter substrate-binding protein (PAAT family) [Duganella sp. BK701]SEK70006.1 amino acid ABC transporter substrate-binding protein, PAAT family (TC 3.A.1.3.-) [Duganella sp. CF402]
MNPIRFVCLLLWLLGGVAEAAPLKIYGMESGPISFLNGARPDGYAVELALAIQQRLGQRDPIEIVPWARANTLAVVGPGVMLLSIVRTAERAKNMHFVGPIFNTRVTAFALKGMAAGWRQQNLDLHKLRAGARRGSIFVSLPRAQGYNMQDETNTSETAAKMLVNRRFDLWFDGEELYAEALRLAGYRETEVEVAFRLDLVEVHFAFSNGTPQATIDAWDRTLREMKRDGSLLKIYRKWLPLHQLPADVPLSH